MALWFVPYRVIRRSTQRPNRAVARVFSMPDEMLEHLGVDAVGLLVQVRDFELGLDVDLVFDVGAHAVLLGLAVLADQHEARQEDRFERHDHRQQAERDTDRTAGCRAAAC